MPSEIEPLPPEQEVAVRARLAANPFIRFVGIQVPQLGRGYARFLMAFKPEMANSIGLLQGGLIAALADEAVAYALHGLVPPDENVNTVEMKINFLAPVKEGEVEAVARIIKRGRTISLGEAEVRQGPRLVAKAMCTYIHLAKR
ncbi:MAG: PaaI family thioesterase [Desulfobaccales bacterium]